MEHNFLDNEILVRNLVKGNEKAYVFMINTFHQALFIYALSLTDNTAMAKDIVQNVFIKTWEYRANLKTHFPIKNFLYKSVYNEFINHYHRNQSISNLEKAYVEALSEVVENTNEESFKRKLALVTNVIETLPPKCKQTFVLSKKEGLTNIEIAEYLNVSIKSVEAHITKAYSIIREEAKSKLTQIYFSLFRINKRLNH